MSRGITWLASYPKSGNTWVRALLTSYRRGGDVDLDQLDGGPIASARGLFDSWAGVSASDLAPAEVDLLRADLYRWRAAEATAPLVIKAHDAWTRRPDGLPLFPADVSRGVIYIVRHPADVAVSFASHSGITVDESVERLCRPDFTLAGSADRLSDQLPQHLLSWSRHVSSWLDQQEMPALLIRFEDLLMDPSTSLMSILRFLQWDIDSGRVEAAVDASRFEVLQRREREGGFKERPARAAGPFFREGAAGRGRAVLTETQWHWLCVEHGAMMQRMGYEESR